MRKVYDTGKRDVVLQIGGLVTFEAVQQLRRKGENVAVLALLIDTAYPAGTIKPLIERLHIGKNQRELSQLPTRENVLSSRGKLARFSL